MTHPKLTRIYIVVLAFSIALATITCIGLADFVGLNISDYSAILTSSENAPIFLNGDTFRSSPKTPGAAWFTIDKYSLTSILKHNYKAYPKEFSPRRFPLHIARISKLRLGALSSSCSSSLLASSFSAYFFWGNWWGTNTAPSSTTKQ